MVMFIVFNAAELRLKLLLRSGSNGSMRLSARFNAAELRFKGFMRFAVKCRDATCRVFGEEKQSAEKG
jgi:hypothetical protein